jgi:hypothetical protein
MKGVDADAGRDTKVYSNECQSNVGPTLHKIHSSLGSTTGKENTNNILSLT